MGGVREAVTVPTCWLVYQYRAGPFRMNQKRCHFWAMKTLLSFLFFHSQPSQSGMPSSRHDTRRRLMAVVIPAKTELQRLVYTEKRNDFSENKFATALSLNKEHT